MNIKDTLDIPIVWNTFRWILDLTFGVYKKRKALLSEWHVSDGTVLDVACGTAHFCDVTSKGYLGVDLNCDYIDRAKRLFSSENVEFRCLDVADLSVSESAVDTVFLIGIIHHLDDVTTQHLLEVSKKLAKKQLIVMEVIQEQTNPFGRWIKDNDRGQYVRNLDVLRGIVAQAGFKLEDERVV